jgi:hypothetical protein
MAEISREQWLFWKGFGVITSSPLASVVAISNDISTKASLDEVFICGKVHWGAEVSTWDKFFTG